MIWSATSSGVCAAQQEGDMARKKKAAVEAEPVEPRPQRLGLRDAMAKVFDYCGGTHAPPTPPEPDAPLCVWYGCFDSV